MKIPFLDLRGQDRQLRPAFFKEISRVFNAQQFVLKKQVEAFEAAAARYLKIKHAIGLASGTDALFLSLAALGIGPKDEVITTPFTFFATAGAISRVGATPVFCDIDPESLNLDPKKIENKVSRRTKAILPVHLFGLPCDMDAIQAIAKRRSLFVVEDAAQSFGASYRSRQTGTMGDAGCFSFYPTKNLGGAGDGGMVVTSSDTLAKHIRILRDHGQTKKYIHEFIGTNSRLDELQAAVLRIKLRKIDTWNARRRTHGAFYNRALSELPIQRPSEKAWAKSIYHLYSILTDRRDELASYLTERGIGNGVYYPLPLHLQPCYKSLGYRLGDLPVAESVSKRILSLPLFPELTQRQAEIVVKAVRGFFKK